MFEKDVQKFNHPTIFLEYKRKPNVESIIEFP